MTYAAIDIGSNTVLLLVAKYQDGSLEILHEEQRTPRLGKGVDASANLHPASVQNALKTLRTYQKIVDKNFPDVVETIVTATSAVRDAANRGEFLNEILKNTGYRVRVLSGSEEAELTFTGALSTLQNIGHSLVIDIGGGSTEIIFGNKVSPIDRFSYDMGSVRFTERYLQEDPPAPREIETCRAGIRETLQQRDFSIGQDIEADQLSVIGAAGTIISLAVMDLGLDDYEPSLINGHVMDIESIHTWIEQLALLPVSELKTAFPKVMEGRADVFLAGLLILETFMEHNNLHELVVSKGGIRHGAILNYLI